MSVVETARSEWEDSSRRLADEARDDAHYAQLLEQLEAVTAELRRRVGQTFTLAELAEAYTGADDWSRDAVAAMEPPPGWPTFVALVQGAAFHEYARGALDYAP